MNYYRNLGVNKLNASLFFHQEYERTGPSNQTYHWQNFAGNLNYTVEEKYFLDATLAFQGSNRIQDKEDRWGLFPTLSAGWLVSEEDFLAESQAVDVLKLRASWGMVGNGLIPISHLTLPRFGYTSSGYRFGSTNQNFTGWEEKSPGIPLKIFESSYETNLGMDATLWKNLVISGDLFYQKRTHILVESEGRISDVIGISVGDRAEGIVTMKGLEGSAGWQEQMGDFSYFVNVMASYASSEVINQNEQYRPEDYLKREGESIGQYFGLESKGFFQDQADIDGSPLQEFGEVSIIMH